MQTQPYNPKISDLRELALAVMRPDESAAMSARTAARCLSGVVNLCATKYGTVVMHRACGELVRSNNVWATSLGTLPDVGFVEGAEQLSSAIELVAVVARGILPIAGAANMRAALSFWACETDPAVWMLVTAG
jgi:hypothetical protein